MEKKCSSNFQQIDLSHLTYEQEWFLIFEDNCSTADHLFLTQEEADTRLLLDAHDVSLNYQDIIIHTPDADVLILFITMWVIEPRIFIKTEEQVEKVVNGI